WRRAGMARAAVKAGMVEPRTEALTAVVRARPFRNSIWFSTSPRTAQTTTSGRSRAAKRSRPRRRAATRKATAPPPTRTSTTALAGMWLTAALPNTASAAKQIWTRTGRTWTVKARAQYTLARAARRDRVPLDRVRRLRRGDRRGVVPALGQLPLALARHGLLRPAGLGAGTRLPRQPRRRRHEPARAAP